MPELQRPMQMPMTSAPFTQPRWYVYTIDVCHVRLRRRKPTETRILSPSKATSFRSYLGHGHVLVTSPDMLY